MDNLEQIFRKFTIEKLETLKAIIDSPDEVTSTTTVSGTLTLEGRGLGGRLSSLTRTKIDSQPLILAAGRTAEDGVLWRLNTNIASKDTIQALVDKILDENKDFRMATTEKKDL